MPITTTVRPTSASNSDEKEQPDDRDGEPERAQMLILEARDGRETATPGLRRNERQQSLDHEIERQTRKKISPGQSLKPPMFRWLSPRS